MLDEYLSFAADLARQGGKLIKDNLEAQLDVEIKPDNTPVTQIDKQINDLIIEAVRAKYPEHGVLGEEANFGSGNEEYRWLLDPLDGTASFVVGTQHSTCILGLLKGAELQLAVIYDPYTDRLYAAAKGQGATCNDQPIHVSSQTLAEGYVLTEAMSPEIAQKLIDAKVKLEPAAGAGYRCALIARGRAVATVKNHFDFHDVGPGSLIVEEAGGKVTDLQGRPLQFDQPSQEGIILSNGVCHDDIIALLKQ